MTDVSEKVECGARATVVLSLNDPALAEMLAGRSFQVNHLGGARVELRPLKLEPAGTRCPVVIGGERCGLSQGHEGKHMWGRGD
jgi:hypothetical protein